MSHPTNAVFRTTDLDLASFLSARGFRLRQAVPPEPGTYPQHARFEFDRSDALVKCVDEWENRRDQEVLVNVDAFSRARAEFYRRAREVAG